MFRTASIMLALTTASASAAAQDTDNWRCTYNDLVRRVEIVYQPGRAVPCEVHYFKDVELPDERKVLWRAENEAGYCEARAEELIAKLEGQGWSCDAGGAAPTADAAEEAAADEEPVTDDTDALAPANEEQQPAP